MENPNESGKYTVEIFVWENLQNQKVLDSNYTLQIHVS